MTHHLKGLIFDCLSFTEVLNTSFLSKNSKALLINRNPSTSLWPSPAGSWTGVQLSFLSVDSEAPALIRSSTTSLWPFHAASWRGVEPFKTINIKQYLSTSLFLVDNRYFVIKSSHTTQLYIKKYVIHNSVFIIT